MSSSASSSSSSENETESKPPAEHSEYYLCYDPMAIFLVENTLFRVHRYFLVENSCVFKSMFDCPQAKGVVEEGLTNENPIHLPGVLAIEFQLLMDYFYKRKDVRRLVELTREGLEKQLQLLSIATRFDFDNIRRQVIEGLTQWRDFIDPIERIILAEKYDIQEWFVPAYYQLCLRERSLDEGEAIRLGFKITVLAAHIRERARIVPRYSRFESITWTEPQAPDSKPSRKDVLKRVVPKVADIDEMVEMVEKVLGFTTEQ